MGFGPWVKGKKGEHKGAKLEQEMDTDLHLVVGVRRVKDRGSALGTGL